MQRTRRLAVLCTSALLAMAMTLTAAAPADAAERPRRSDSESTVIFVHGYAPTGGHDCADYFRQARKWLNDRHWDGRLHTWGYYRADENCTWEYPGNRNSSLNTVAQALALKIYRAYSSSGKKVDIVAHSMGGLIVRTMLRHVKLKGGTGGWPRYLYVEDVVTLGTPHDGTGWAERCDGFRQCRQMEPGSSFIDNLENKLYESAMGTDWTLVSTFKDAIVSEGSGVGAHAQHKIQYKDLPGFDHLTLKSEYRGEHTGRVKHRSWSGYHEIDPPLERTRLALYKHSTR